ncbi:MAG: hypothetical protein ACREJ6_15730 [Candidatus Methylomirabilis sp.]
MAISDKALQNGIPDSSGKPLWIYTDPGSINKGPKRSRHSKAFPLLDFMRGQFVSMVDDARRRFLAEFWGYSEVNSRRHQVTDAMYRHGGLMGCNGDTT